ncbi:MAG: VanZ family protein [Motilibacteraceae bacterium]
MTVGVEQAGAGVLGAKALPAAAWLLAGSVGALGAAGIVVESFWRQPQVRIALAVLAVGGVVLGAALARRTGRSVVLVVLAVWAVAGILLLTVLPQSLDAVSNPWRLHRVVLDLSPHPAHDLTAWMHGTDGPLNVLLYLPAGALVAAVTRRPGRTLLALTGLSLGIEIVQALTGWRSGSLGDVVANVLGAMLGICATLAVLATLHRGRAAAGPTRSIR